MSEHTTVETNPADAHPRPTVEHPVRVDIHDPAEADEPARAEDQSATAAAAQEPSASTEPQPAEQPVETPAAPPPVAGHDRASTRIIALMNQKGGVGKTTTVVNVAAALARAGHRVLAIDLDPQAHLSLSLGIDPEAAEHTVYHLLTDRDVSALQVIQQVDGPDMNAKQHRKGEKLAVIPAEVALAGVESELAELLATGMAQSVLRNKLKPVVDQFDYILLDCPPSLGLLTINALVLAREVIVPMQAHFLALQGMSKLFETVQMVGQGINPELRIAGIVLCMHEANTILAGEVIGDLNGFLDEARDQDVPWKDAVVFQPPVRRNIKLAESPSFGQPIFDYAPDSHGASDYARLAEAITAHRVAAS